MLSEKEILFFGLYLGLGLLVNWGATSWPLRLAFMEISGLAICLAVLIIVTLKKGTWNRKKNPKWAIGITMAGLIFMTISFLTLSEGAEPMVRLQLNIYLAVFLTLFSPVIIQYLIHQAHLKTEERLLELQCQIAELSERIGSFNISKQ